MDFEVEEERRLMDGGTLRLVSWLSDVIAPGEKMFQLEFITEDELLTICFPRNYDNFSEKEIRGVYNTVQSLDHLDLLADLESDLEERRKLYK